MLNFNWSLNGASQEALICQLLRSKAKHAPINTCHGTLLIVDIDDELASAILETERSHQRRVNENTVRKYVASMEETDPGWVMNALPIYVDRQTGELFDGQHRMLALAKKNGDFFLKDAVVSIASLKDIYPALDQGRKRTVSDVQRCMDIDPINKSIIAGILLEHYNFVDKSNAVSFDKQNRIANESPYLASARKLGGAPKSVIAAAVRCMRVDEDLARKFFSALISNTCAIDGQYIPSIAHLARWYHTRDKRHTRDANREVVSRCIRHWNAMRTGEVVRKALPYRPGSMVIEAV